MRKAVVVIFLLFSITYYPIRQLMVRNLFHESQLRPKEEGKYRVLLLWRKGLGEHEFVARFENACEKLGWQCVTITTHQNFFQRLYMGHPYHEIYEKVDPDFTIHLQDVNFFPKSFNYAILPSPNHIESRGTRFEGFDGYLPIFHKEELLEQKLKSLGREYRGMIWHPTCLATNYEKVKPNRIFFCGSNWDFFRKSSKYKEMFQMLAEKDYLDVYGPQSRWKHIAHVWRGRLPFDGVSLQNAMKQAGIALVLHAKCHLEGVAPTSRIFEAAAANCVIISDRHPFVVEEFGDCILYIDHTQDASEMFEQIDHHYAWIQAHPDEALKMAKKAHDIFISRFTLEEQLENLAEFHEDLAQSRAL